ncbi:MAG: hypothetical protein IJ829_02580, partial [Kiritimatiellae bacterium]|nr:hypothetical protein [Kiritimatiellia bacterium]
MIARAALGLSLLAPLAARAVDYPVDFRRPEVIPAPQRLEYKANAAVRLDGSTAFVVDCPAAGARDLAAAKLREFFDIPAPAVSLRPAAGEA